MDDEAPTDLQRLKAMVAALETSDKPCVEWLLILITAKRVLKGYAKH